MVNAPEVVEQLRQLGPDVNLSNAYDQIVRGPLLEIARTGFINIHFEILPSYRQRNIINWVIINNKDYVVVTAHFVDEGVDTGEIILQRRVPIG